MDDWDEASRHALMTCCLLLLPPAVLLCTGRRRKWCTVLWFWTGYSCRHKPDHQKTTQADRTTLANWTVLADQTTLADRTTLADWITLADQTTLADSTYKFGCSFMLSYLVPRFSVLGIWLMVWE